MKDRHDAYLNLNVRGLTPSATVAIKQRCRELRAEGRKVYDFGLGQSPFPVPRTVVDALRFHAAEKDYLAVEGLPELREAVARYHERKTGVQVRADDVLVGPGSKELMFLLQLAYYGDLIVPTPCWVSYVPQAQILGRRIRHIHASFEDGWHVIPEKLADLCKRDPDRHRPRILVLNYPANPHGLTYSADELKAIADVAREYNIVLLSDEIYGELHFKGEHVSVAKFYPEGTIISTGLSKWCGAGGWRLGCFAFPQDLDWLKEAMAAVASETFTSTSAPIQFAAVKAFQGSTRIERYLWHCRRILNRLTHECAERLEAAGVRVHKPEGGFYLFADFSPLADALARRGMTDSERVCQRLLEETGVAALPGTSFQRDARELTARLSLVNFDGTKALTASETTPLDQMLADAFTTTWCAETQDGVEAIAQWLQAPK